MTLKISTCALATALTCAIAVLPTVAGAADHELRFASINLAGTAAYAKVLEPFVEAVQKESGGRIEIALKPLGGYGKPNELFGMVEKGEIEIAATVQGYSVGRFPQSSVMELPLMYQDSVAGTDAMMKLHKEGLLDKDYASVKVLGLYVLPPYGIMTTGKKMTQLKDLRGMRVRSPSPTVGLALAKLGTIPIGVPVNLIGETIANGTVDAITYGWDSITTAKGFGDKKLVEQVSVMIDMNFAAPALMVVMNKAKWDALPADLKAVIEKHSPALSRDNAKLREELEAVAKKKFMTDSNYTYIGLTPEQRADMERLITPAVNDWKASMTKLGIDGERLYSRARELVQQYKVAAN